MLIKAGIVLVISNLIDLSAIASVGSACSLLIFLLVGASGYRLRRETGSIGAIVLLGMATTAVVLVFFAIDTLRNAPQDVRRDRQRCRTSRGARSRLEANPWAATGARWAISRAVSRRVASRCDDDW
jgi:hypothetical protein